MNILGGYLGRYKNEMFYENPYLIFLVFIGATKWTPFEDVFMRYDLNHSSHQCTMGWKNSEGSFLFS